jgi:hypothetical protein
MEYGRNSKECANRISSDRIKKKDFKMSTKRIKQSKISKTMEEFCFFNSPWA